MSRVVARHRGLFVTAGGAAMVVAALSGLPACSAFLEDFVYDDAGPAGKDGAVGDGGLDATTSAADATTEAGTAAGGDGAAASDATADARDGGGDDEGEGASASPYRAAVYAAGPTAYWRFGEQQGAIAHSVTGGGAYSATYINVGLGVPGAIDGDPDTAVNFDGAMGVVRWSGAFSQIDQELFAIEMWIRPTTPVSSAFQFLMKYLDSTRLSLFYEGMSGASLHLAESDDDGTENDDSTADMVVGSWNYVVFQSNGVVFDLYLNQALVASTPALAPAVGADAGEGGVSPMINIGGDENDYSTFAGDIDEVAVYPMPLSAMQMAVHYHLAGAHVGGP